MTPSSGCTTCERTPNSPPSAPSTRHDCPLTPPASNVDRFWAIWQDLNPNSFITPQPAPTSTFGVNRGATETENTGLTPFWDKSGTKFWTSAQVKDSAATFGYAYPETQKWQFASTSDYQEALRRTVSNTYGSNVF